LETLGWYREKNHMKDLQDERRIRDGKKRSRENFAQQ
jgi:hypothetical protein